MTQTKAFVLMNGGVERAAVGMHVISPTMFMMYVDGGGACDAMRNALYQTDDFLTAPPDVRLESMHVVGMRLADFAGDDRADCIPQMEAVLTQCEKTFTEVLQ